MLNEYPRMYYSGGEPSLAKISLIMSSILITLYASYMYAKRLKAMRKKTLYTSYTDSI